MTPTATGQAMTYEAYLLNEGREQQGQAMFLRLLRRKFADVPAEVVHKVEAADLDQLGRWIDRIFTTDSLDDLFAD